MARVTGIAYVRYQAPDLDLMERFLLDFGLRRASRSTSALYMRGTGDSHHIHITERGPQARGVGIGLTVDSRAELETIAAQAGRDVEESNEPGGGVRAVLSDPNGFRVDILHGLEVAPPVAVRAPLVLNHAGVNPRLGTFQRPLRGPTHVSRLEHAVLACPDFGAARAFYEGLLGMKISDRLYAGAPDATVVAFLHCGLGERYTDHHTVALMQSDRAAIDHCAFVALDWDDLMLGHQHLKAAGHFHEWGVGRHILGSEVFDYWRDPFGHKLEHCVDGDMVNDDHVASNVSIEDDILSIWSPPISPTFGEITALQQPVEPE
ncbi:VOC family protein [Rhizorhabdus dicambivorans]|uniref:Glyoxalase n=1 Tax=Rhizorhabdus dicambivorans TaxID=1850238 RepID=A0A2A4FUL8_9SPHN|nr:VOC family protein [Rhizorhabdus dicambivorans]ATE65495.1 glyoxalase [Rhizorhabdus dicambivorans]PCE41839.1 glyoxalase [Rhizorhabdus dicambivorans]